MLRQKIIIPADYTKGVFRTLLIPICLIALMWSIELWDVILSVFITGDATHGILDRLGIQPRRPEGLPGIILAPFLHRGFGHLAGNTLPLLFLSVVLVFAGLRQMVTATLIIVLVTGAFVWLLGGSGTVHIGASGLVFGYLGFLLVKGFIEKRARWIVVSVVTGFFYASFLHGLLPGREGVSWLSHFFGFASGILASWILAQSEATKATVVVTSPDSSEPSHHWKTPL